MNEISPEHNEKLTDAREKNQTGDEIADIIKLTETSSNNADSGSSLVQVSDYDDEATNGNSSEHKDELNQVQQKGADDDILKNFHENSEIMTDATEKNQTEPEMRLVTDEIERKEILTALYEVDDDPKRKMFYDELKKCLTLSYLMLNERPIDLYTFFVLVNELDETLSKVNDLKKWESFALRFGIQTKVDLHAKVLKYYYNHFMAPRKSTLLAAISKVAEEPNNVLDAKSAGHDVHPEIQSQHFITLYNIDNDPKRKKFFDTCKICTHQMLIIKGNPVDSYKLFVFIDERGGIKSEDIIQWKECALSLGLQTNENVLNALMSFYDNHLAPYRDLLLAAISEDFNSVVNDCDGVAMNEDSPEHNEKLTDAPETNQPEETTEQSSNDQIMNTKYASADQNDGEPKRLKKRKRVSAPSRRSTRANKKIKILENILIRPKSTI
ncbi:uncharacterized protein LOC116340596 [Contarinia nasturtii]|uniref:uncharacterized protein LOC116340596 n=1 Tax=Contarinia nasturtii TaxID=265458 RepID=UPI0012D44709|nr:uncharacterized protein LOC116340596 [Contarinia nasturtii]